MDFENTITDYWKTLIQKNVSNITINKFLKKPYLENYIIKLAEITDNNLLIDKVCKMLKSNIISNEEILLFINKNIDISKENEYFILNNDSEDNKIFIDIILYEIKYFRFYYTITELLFDSKSEDNELYYFILIYIKNDENDIKTYTKKNIKFSIFNYYLNDLFNTFEIISLFFMDNNNIEITKNLFIKNIFLNWYNIYRKDLINDSVNKKIKDYIISKSLLSKILCFSNA